MLKVDYESIVGKKFTTKNKCILEVIEYLGNRNYKVIISGGAQDYLTIKRYYNILTGVIDNPYSYSVYGVGYLGEGIYERHINKVETIVYLKWYAMFKRCYSKASQEKNPSYKDVTVCEEWHNFQNFAKWFYENWKPWMDKAWHLDKDILIKGNKVYSPETCCFVPHEVNQFFINRNRITKKDKDFNGDFQVYLNYKGIKAKNLLQKYKHKIDFRVYEALYNYKNRYKNEL